MLYHGVANLTLYSLESFDSNSVDSHLRYPRKLRSWCAALDVGVTFRFAGARYHPIRPTADTQPGRAHPAYPHCLGLVPKP